MSNTTSSTFARAEPWTLLWLRSGLATRCTRAGGALRRWKLSAALLVCAAACGAAYGTPTTATWNGSTANWSTGADWSTSPYYPQADNPTGVYYVAQINQSGAGPYTLTLDSSFNSSTPLYVDGITINNANATFDQPGGTFADLSQLDVSGTPPGALNVQAGTYELAGGTLADAVLTVGGTGVFNLTSGTFQNVTLGSAITLNNSSSYLYIANTAANPTGLIANGNGITLSGNSSLLDFQDAYSSGYIGQTIDNTAINLTGNGAYVEGGSGTLTIGAHATIAGLAANSSNILGGSDIVNNGVIDASTSANGETLYLDPSSFTNNGTISVDANLQLSATTWSNTNTGLIRVSSGGVADFFGTWSNTGTIQGASGATFNLDGTFHPADVGLASSGTNGTFTPNGSTVNLTGTLDNTSNTLTFGSGSGVWNLTNNGTIQNGTLIVNNQTNGQPYLEIQNGTFQNVTLGSNLTLNNNSAFLSLANTVANPNGLTTNNYGVTLSGNSSSLDFQEAYSSGYVGQTIDNTAINLTGAYAYVEGGSGTLTIGAHATIAGLAANSNNTLGGSDIVNNGVIDASTSANGETLYLNPSSFTNNNLISVSANLQLDATNWSNTSTGLITVSSGVATFSGNWSNTGAIQGFGATFNLDGTFHPADVGLASSGTNGTFTPNGSTVNLTGILDNTSNTLTFGSGSGVWNLKGGTIQNGTVVVNNQTNGQPYLEIQNGTFQNVTLGGNLTLNNSNASLNITNTVANPTGLTPNNYGVTLSGANSNLYFTDAYNSGTSQYVGQTIDNTAINLTGAGAYVEGGSGTLTIGAHATIAGLAANSSNTLGGSDIVNNGVIDASTSANGETLYLNPSSLTNNNLISVSANLQLDAANWSNTSTGLITVSSGVATFSGNWSNTGTIQGFGATFNLGGTFHPADVGLASSGTNGTFTPNGSTVNLTGILDNTSNTLTFGSGSGVWNLKGGTIQNGTVVVNNQTNGQPYLEIQNGTFQNVTLGSNLTLNNSSASLSIANTVANPNGLITNGNGITLSGSLFFTDAYSSGYVGQTIDNTTINLTGAGAYVNGGSGTLTIGTNATIAGLAANSRNTLGGSDIVNNGVINSGANGESIYLDPTTFSNNGVLEATNGGSLSVSVGFTNTGTVDVGGASTLTIEGNYTQVSPGTTTVNGSLVLDYGGSLSIATGTTVDISNTSASTVNANVLINYGSAGSPNSAIRNYLISGYNAGAWNGPGISSTAASASRGVYSLGYADGADGVAYLNSTTKLATDQEKIMYTLGGDANLDGTVTLSDFAILRSNFGKTGMQWDQGDFNYDGTVSLSDFAILRSNFGKTLGPAAAISSAPEPATLGLLAMGGLGLLVRRMRGRVKS